MCIRDRLKGWCSLSEMSSLEEGQEALQQQELAALIVLPEHVVEGTVSYTHLDVYKRQAPDTCTKILSHFGGFVSIPPAIL